MDNGWYVVYILMCFLNGALYASMGHNLFNSWQFWVGMFVPILSYIAGTNRC